MAHHERAESTDVIDEAISVRIPCERPIASHHDRLFVADRSIRADRTVDAAGEKLGSSLTPSGDSTGPDHII